MMDTLTVDTPVRANRPLGSVSWALIVAGALFVAYPALRPYSSEQGLAGAQALGSERWVLAHVCGMVAFALTAAAVNGLKGAAAARWTALAGTALILPYYGAEAFGLHAVGVAANARGDGTLIDVADEVRNNGMALTLFTLGWLGLAAAGALFARYLWARSARVAAGLTGAGLVLYLPQFFGPPLLRIAHGAVLAVGLWAAAIALRDPRRHD